jgi:lactoylglutathione lyase
MCFSCPAHVMNRARWDRHVYQAAKISSICAEASAFGVTFGIGDYAPTMRYLHTMLRVQDLDRALAFFVNQLGLRETRRRESDKGRFTLVFLSSGAAGDSAEIELTYNWDQSEPYPTGRFFGHLAYAVDDIYETCERLRAAGVDILRPPRDGHMAFVKSPDGHSIELLQRGGPLPPQEPWSSMQNQGSW